MTWSAYVIITKAWQQVCKIWGKNFNFAQTGSHRIPELMERPPEEGGGARRRWGVGAGKEVTGRCPRT